MTNDYQNLYLEALTLYNEEKYEEALNLTLECYEHGVLEAYNLLAKFYYNGHGVEVNFAKSFEIYIELFDKNRNIEAAHYLGVHYFYGQGCEKNYSKALYYFNASLEGNYPYTFFFLGFMYFRGYGVEVDYKEALKWFTASVNEIDDGRSMAYIGELYLDGYGVEKDAFKALMWLEKSVAKGSDAGKFYLARCLCFYDDSIKDFPRALELFKELAECGNSISYYFIGLMYFYGKGTEVDGVKAHYWLLKSVESRNNKDAMDLLGSLYFAGDKGIEKDYKKAHEWFLKAANNGCVDAYMHLGVTYYYGKGVERNDSLALEYFFKAAENNFPSSYFYIGESYYCGTGVAKDYKKAYEWLLKGALEGNDERAMCQLGNIFSKGCGVAVNDEEAMKWYKKASDLGQVDASFEVATRYFYGKNCVKDYNASFDLFDKLCQKGFKKAYFYLGLSYFKGYGVKQDYPAALKYFLKSIEVEDDDGYLYAGLFYLNGYTHEVDYPKAFEYFNKAAKSKVEAYLHLAYCYEYGYGTEINIPEAVRCLKKTFADFPSETAMKLINILDNKKADSKTSKEILELIKEGARKGNTPCKNFLSRRWWR